MSVATKRVRVDGVEIAWHECGVGERPLVLVHGFTGYGRDFATQMEALETLGRTLAPDLRGHGDSTNTGEAADYTLEILAQDLRAWLAALGIERCDLLGHSMGGMVVLRVALDEPQRVASLILMETAPGPLDIDGSTLELAGRIAREAGMSALAQLVRARSGADAKRSAADRRVEEEWGEERFWKWRTGRIEAMDPEAFVAFGAVLGDHADLTPRLGEIGCPTLVMVGSDDEEFLAPSDVLARGISRAERITIPNAGHQPQHEAAAAWFEAIRAHLARVR